MAQFKLSKSDVQNDSDDSDAPQKKTKLTRAEKFYQKEKPELVRSNDAAKGWRYLFYSIFMFVLISGKVIYDEINAVPEVE